jgi:hypothetical protein
MFGSNWGYKADFLGQKGVDIIAFKNGALWTQNTNPIQNNYFGEQQHSEIWVYLNINPENNKVLQAIKQRGLLPFSVIVENAENQTTHLLESNFDAIEDIWYSEVLMDENTPNVTNPIFEGDYMRSRTFLMKFRYDGTDYNKLFELNLQVTGSDPSVK